MFWLTLGISALFSPVILFAVLKPKPLPGIPRNTQWYHPILGDLPAFLAWLSKEASPSTFLQAQADKLGPVCQVIIGTRRMIVITDVQEIEDIFIRRSKTFDRSKEVMNLFKATLGGSQVCMPTGPVWSLHRRIFGPSMQGHYLKRMTPRIIRNIQGLIQIWNLKHEYLSKAASVSGKAWSSSFEAHQDIVHFTVDVITNLSIGRDFDCQRTTLDSLSALPPATEPVKDRQIFAFPIVMSDLFTAFRWLWRRTMDIYVSPLPAMTEYLMQRRSAWQVARAKVSTFLQGEISLRKDMRNMVPVESHSTPATPATSNDTGETVDDSADCIISMVLAQGGGGEKMTDKEIEDELLGLLFAGQDTTASTTSWLLKHLAHNPHIQHTLRAELLSVLAADDMLVPSSETDPIQSIQAMRFDQVTSSRLPYLEAVTAEALRCPGVIAPVPRDAKEDTVVLGHTVPKGSVVLCFSAHAGNLYNEGRAQTHPHWVAATPDPEAAIRSDTSRKAARERPIPKWDDNSDMYNFRPERWLDTVKEADGEESWVFNPKKGYTLGFGAGPRGCFGKPVAMLEMRLIIAMLNLAFFFDRVPDEVDGMAIKEEISIQPVNCFVNPKKWSEREI